VKRSRKGLSNESELHVTHVVREGRGNQDKGLGKWGKSDRRRHYGMKEREEERSPTLKRTTTISIKKRRGG